MNYREEFTLNGVWHFQPDPVGDGEARGFMLPTTSVRGWRETAVPACFEDGCPDLDFYRGVCWYRRTVRLPEDRQARRVIIRFEGVNYRARVWLNGCLLGENTDGFLPFEFPLDAGALMDGDNVLAVAVDNAPREGDVRDACRVAQFRRHPARCAAARDRSSLPGAAGGDGSVRRFAPLSRAYP